MISIDLNCDMGEGMGNEEALLPFISSANIACGYHAGDEDEMKRVVDLCLKHGVAMGAHPSFADKDNFGRIAMPLAPRQVYELVKEQINILGRIIKEAGGVMEHVKPHGALYNITAKDPLFANAVAKAVADADPSLVYYGLSGSVMIDEAAKLGLQTARESFADRTYMDDGSLTPRSHPAALIENTADALSQVLQMINDKTVRTINGKLLALEADTICLHGDGVHAEEFVIAINNGLRKAGIQIKKIRP